MTDAEIHTLRKKHPAAPQLLHVDEGTRNGGKSDDGPSFGDLEGAALVSPAAGIIV